MLLRRTFQFSKNHYLKMYILRVGEKPSARSANGYWFCTVNMLRSIHVGLCSHCWSSTLLFNGSGYTHLLCLCYSWNSMGSVSRYFSPGYSFEISELSFIAKLLFYVFISLMQVCNNYRSLYCSLLNVDGFNPSTGNRYLSL